MADVAEILPLRAPPALVARVDRNERFNTGSTFGDLRVSRLSSILSNAAQGDIAEWIDLCEFMLEDDLVGSLHTTRMLRVTQADWIVAPSTRGDQGLARQAADFCSRALDRIDDWPAAVKMLLHAVPAGVSVGQMDWKHDRDTRAYYVDRIVFTHGHRFRYDETWNLRLYDRGREASRASLYGRALDPDVFLVHRHLANATYPGKAGQLRQVAFAWCFRRIVDKMWLQGVDRAGNPMVYAKVPANTRESVRAHILEDLEQIANNSVGVVNDDVEIEAQAAAAATRSYEAYQQYMEWNKGRIVTNYLGASDVVSPGENGSQAAVSTRASTVLDPRMVDDGLTLSATIRGQLFKALLKWNAHLFGVPFDQIPIPDHRFKTADDEVKRDDGDKATEIRDEHEADGVPAESQHEPSDGDRNGEPAAKPGDTDVQAAALNGAQVTAMVEIIKSVANGELPRASGVELLVSAFPVSRQQAERLMGDVGDGFEAKPPADDVAPQAPPTPEPPDPKASPRASTRGETSAVARATSSRLPSPIVLALSSGLVGSARSSTKRSRKQPKR